MTKTKFSFLITFLFFTVISMTAKDFVLVIDAGHGGHDHGAIGSFTNEKSINLAVSKLFGEMVSKNCKNVKVIYTRSNDTFISLKERARIANDAKGDLFVAIHVNSVDKAAKNRSSVAGAEVYTLGLHKTAENLAVARKENSVIELEKDSQFYKDFDPESPESYIIFELSQSANIDKSIDFAEKARNELVSTGQRKDKGVKQAGFWVLWASNMPSVLVELDFICNPDSERFLASSEGQEKLATSLYNAFVDYLSANGFDSGKKQTRGSNNRSQTQTPPPPPKKEKDAYKNTGGKNGVEYRVQILASEKKLKENDSEFKGLKNTMSYYENSLYKYTIGSVATQEEAQQILNDVRSKFPNAFIVKFIDGKRVKM